MNHVEAQMMAMDQLRVGQYVHLDLKWFEHPFAFSQFKIKTEEQIKVIRSLGLNAVRINPELSDLAAMNPANASATPAVQFNAAPPPGAEPAPSPIVVAKQAMLARMRLRRQDTERIEKAFINTGKTIRDIEKNLYSRPLEAMQQASLLIGQMTESILSAPELAIQVMGDKMGGDELYLHSLNVTMLSIMMARDIKLPIAVVGVLGVGALLHDIGRKELPDKILRKTEALTQAERSFYEMHCQFGLEVVQPMGLAPAALSIIREHHEMFDGSVYPARLKGESISLLSRIVAIANYYDELCNPPSTADALTPHEALSLMFAKLRSKFDPKLLQVFIRCLGVYPPGTIVQLSNGAIGMVVTVNTARPMKPTLMLYDAEVPKDEAILLDMERETEVNIAKAIRPAQVPQEVLNYLSPRKRVSYYFNASAARPEAGQP